MNKLITMNELNSRNETELRVLFGMVSKQLASTKRLSRERQDALATLENINRALNSRVKMAAGL